MAPGAVCVMPMLVMSLNDRNSVRINDAVTVTLHLRTEDSISVDVCAERSQATQTIQIARGGKCELPFEVTLTFVKNLEDRARIAIEYPRDRVKIERIERSGQSW